MYSTEISQLYETLRFPACGHVTSSGQQSQTAQLVLVRTKIIHLIQQLFSIIFPSGDIYPNCGKEFQTISMPYYIAEVYKNMFFAGEIHKFNIISVLKNTLYFDLLSFKIAFKINWPWSKEQLYSVNPFGC